ncbi:peptidase, putative [Leishmania panamensis]|uniref:Peptidase, putative n=1 Tax=Leishmania panamensis TaxID=5679 RepID=A0A088SAP3_LEIPA
MGLSRGHSPRLRCTEVQIPVILNVYSLVESNKRLSKMGMGIFHTGVVVYGIEWGFGEVVDNPNASGLFCVPPGQAAGTLYRTIRIGHTTRSPMQVDTILHRLENEWRSSEYHILHHNCNHFAQAFCDLLSTTEKLQVPLWCNRAARVGDRVIPRRLATKVQHIMDSETPKAPPPPAPTSKVNEVPTSVVPHEWYLNPSIFQPPRYIDESKPPSVGIEDVHSGTPPEATVGEGGPHHSVEYSVVPQPSCELADAGGVRPPTTWHESCCNTDENGSITHMVTIEEQPSLPSSSRRESARKSTASRRMAKSTPKRSPPPSLSIAFSSGGEDRVVLPCVRASTSQPYSVVPTGSPQVSELGQDVENLLHSETSEEPSPLIVSHLPMIQSPICDTANPRKVTPSGSMTNRSRGVCLEEQQSQQQHIESYSKNEHTNASSKKPLSTMRDSSMQFTSAALSDHEDASAQPPSSSLLASHALAVGCITSLSPTLPSQPPEEVTWRSSDVMAAKHDVSIELTNVSSEVSNNPKGNLAPAKHSSPKEERNRGNKPENEFSDITTALVCDASLPFTTATRSPEAVKRKNSSVWKFLKSQCGLSSHAGSEKAARKYLSTLPPSDKVSFLSDGGPHVDVVPTSPASSVPSSSSSLLQREATQKEAASVVADSGAVADPAADAAMVQGWERDHTHVLPSAAAILPSSPQSMSLILEDKDNGHDAIPNEVQDANDTVPTPTTPAQQNVLVMPGLGGGSPASTTVLQQSSGHESTQLPLNRHPSGAESITEMLREPPERHLSRSETPSAQGGAPSPVRLQDLSLAATASQPMDSSGLQLSPSVVTPERPDIIANSEAMTTGCSPAVAHQQGRRGSSSAAMSDTPPPRREQSQMPIPVTQKQSCSDENVAPAIQLYLSSDELETPVGCNSSYLSGTAERAGTPLTAKTAHTPMEPFSCRPPSLYREKAVTDDGRISQSTSDDGSQAALTEQHSRNTELEDLVNFRLTQSESAPKLDAKRSPTPPPPSLPPPSPCDTQ